MISKLKTLGFETIFLIVGGFAISFLFQWWALAPLFVVMSFALNTPPSRAFAGGFLAGSMLWGLYANYIDSANLSLLSAKVGQLFQGVSTAKLLWLTGTLGGVVGGLAALVGSSLRGLFKF
jgi:hypothetical protein